MTSEKAKQNKIARGRKWGQNNKQHKLEYNKEWISKNHERYLAGVRRRINAKRKQWRKEVIDHYGGKCACCGESHKEFLAVDHIDGNGRQHRQEIHKHYRDINQWLIKNNFPTGFRLLCHNCNQSIGVFGYCPHNKEENVA